jgi:hypothetical protein
VGARLGVLSPAQAQQRRNFLDLRDLGAARQPVGCFVEPPRVQLRAGAQRIGPRPHRQGRVSQVFQQSERARQLRGAAPQLGQLHARLRRATRFQQRHRAAELAAQP